MKKLFAILFTVSCFLFIASLVRAVSYPTPSGFVNDFASLYSSSFKQDLETNLSAFEKATGTEIAVATIKSLEGEDLETYAVELFDKWNIGEKGQDNGLLLLIAKEDRKVRIEVGYGLEPFITDGRAGQIIREQITPEFKKENYEIGTLNAIKELEKYIANKDIAPKEVTSKNSGGISDFVIILAFILIYFVATYLGSYLGRTKEIWPGGAIGAVIGIIIGIVLGSIILSVIIAVFAGGFGLLLDLILTKNYQGRKAHGLPTGFWHSWGGFGGRGWGSGGSGGFGGFGGGSSGGGGASGRW